MVATDRGLYPKGGITQGRRGQALKKLQADCRGSPGKGKTEDAQEKWRSNSHRKERRGCPGQGNRSSGLKVPYIKVHETRVYSAGPELGGEKRLRGWGQTGRPSRLGPREGSFPSAPGPALVQWRRWRRVLVFSYHIWGYGPQLCQAPFTALSRHAPVTKY